MAGATPTDAPLISPISRTSTFPHKTSTAASTRTPFIDTGTPAINTAPVELDSAEAQFSPEGVDAADEATKSDGELRGRERTGSLISPGLGEEEDIESEFLGEGKGVGREVREKRAAMLATRSKDPSVIVDVPNDPTAEEVEAAKSADRLATPALPGGAALR